jgi:hypothetical protein
VVEIYNFEYDSDDSDNEQDECENERTVFFMPRNKRFIPLHKKTTLFSHFHNYHYITYKNIAFIYSVRNKKMMYDKTTGL